MTSPVASHARGRVLHIGAGAGELPRLLADHPAVVCQTVLDPDVSLGDRLRSLELPRLEVVTGSVLTGPLTGRFDTVIVHESLAGMETTEGMCLRRRLEDLNEPGATVVIRAEVDAGEDGRSANERRFLERVERACGPIEAHWDEGGEHYAVVGRRPCRATGPRVSVLLPTWNQAALLPTSIASVLRQTYEDWELVVVDDGSTDDTPDVLARLDDPRCRSVRVAHSGLPPALNVATCLARGELVTWTSSDNWCHPRWLERLVAALDARPAAAFAFSGLQFVDQAGNRIRDHLLADPCIAGLVCQSPGLASFLYRSSCVGEVGFYDPDLALAEDWDYWTRLVVGRDLVYVPEVLYSYRLHSDSLTARETPGVIAAAREVLRRSLCRIGDPPQLEKIYPALRCGGASPEAEADACWDLGVRVLRSPWADPSMARPYLERAVRRRRRDPRFELALSALEACEGQWDAARGRFEAVRAATALTGEDVIANCLDRCDAAGLRERAPGPSPETSDLAAAEAGRYVWPGARGSARTGKTLEANLAPDDWHESITGGTTPATVAEAVRQGAAPAWMQALLSETAEGDRLLELGSGTGELSARLARRGRAVGLFDFSLDALRFARTVFDTLDLPGVFVQGDVMKPLPFGDRSIDVVWSSGLLEHFGGAEIAFIVKEAARVARKRVVALVPNASSLAYRLGKHEQERAGRWIWGREEPKQTLEPVFRAAGLRRIREYSVAPEHALAFLDAPEMAGLRQSLAQAFAALPPATLAALHQGYLLLTVGDIEPASARASSADAKQVPAWTGVIPAARPLWIWGAGRAGVEAARSLRDGGMEPAGFIDSKATGDRRVEGLPVRAPSHLRTLLDEGMVPFVAVASVFASEIVESAETLGLHPPADICVLGPPARQPAPLVAPTPPLDFYSLLHELRGHALADMPPGARTILSAGCSGRWYFDWIEQKYGRVDRHIGVESFLPRPDDLPDNVEWLARDIASVPEVRDGEVDLVFSGQNIEHLWPQQVLGFLLEAHRVLAHGGRLVLDSPNREITASLAWAHPEHTVEYSVDDVAGLLDAAGFADITVRGIWLCRDGVRLLPLAPADATAHSMEVLRRSALARDRARDSFVWWAEARKHHEPRREELGLALQRMFEQAWPERLNRYVVAGPVREDADGRWAVVDAHSRGGVVEGQPFPLTRGTYRIGVRVRGDSVAEPCRLRLEVSRVAGDRETLLASSVAAATPCLGTIAATISLDDDVTFGLRIRIIGEGGGAGAVLLDCRCEKEPS